MARRLIGAAEIIAVGSELLVGGRVETNSIVLSEKLGALGIPVSFKTVVSDQTSDIAVALRTAVTRADLVLVTGGLGPTCDDCTRKAVANVTGRPLRRHREAFEGVCRQLAIWGRIPSRAQLEQALIPRGAEVLANPVGSAPGFWLLWRGTVLAALPGVPDEATAMFDRAVMPRLIQRLGRKARPIDRRVLHTFGLPEADVDRQVTAVLSRTPDVRLGLLASPLGVSIVLTARIVRSVPNRGGRAVLDQAAGKIRQALGQWIFAEGQGTLEEVVGGHLAQQELWLAVAESCTGGLIGHRLTEVPGSSAYLDRVVVSYSNRAKVELLGVPARLIDRYGAVSAEVAAAMARGIRLRSGSDIGLSVTGIAGPAGGTERKPVGLVYIGIDVGRATDRRTMRRRGRSGYQAIREHRFHGSRHTIKLRASQAALELLRQWLMGCAKRERRKPGRPRRR